MNPHLLRLIAVAADLMGPDGPDEAAAEYLRGMTELLAYGFPSGNQHADHDQRKQQIAAAILALAAIGA